MPRLSLYQPEKGNNYKFLDHHISQMFQVGGTDVYLHKYLGPKNPEEGTADQPIYQNIDVTNIQDLLFLENRDRKYDFEIYRIRGLYNVQNIDFNLSQFGLFIDNDTIYMTVHINDFINYIGRKPISGDVLELPHLKDEFSLGNMDISLPRYFVIEDVGRASEGFSPTWYPHLYRLKLKKISANQQFDDILNVPSGTDVDRFVGDYDPTVTYQPNDIIRYNGILYTVTETTTGNTPPNLGYFTLYTGNTLEGILSTRAKELQINDAILEQAEADAPLSGYETRQFYTLAVDPITGEPLLQQTDTTELLASNSSYSVNETNTRPKKSGYAGYLVGDGFPSNGFDFGHGIQFPVNPGVDDYFLRTDFMPNRLFRFDGFKWIKIEDNLRMTMTNNSSRYTQKTGFINNNEYIYNNSIAVDFTNLSEGDYIIDTEIDYTTSLFVVLNYEVIDVIRLQLEYEIAEHPEMIINNLGKIQIALPVVNEIQQVIPYTGTWRITLYNNREAQRQSISKALRPRADF